MAASGTTEALIKLAEATLMIGERMRTLESTQKEAGAAQLAVLTEIRDLLDGDGDDDDDDGDEDPAAKVQKLMSTLGNVAAMVPKKTA